MKIPQSSKISDNHGDKVDDGDNAGEVDL